MTELLKNQLNQTMVQKVGASISKVYPEFLEKEFVDEVMKTLDQLELKDRARLIADQLKAYLPDDYAVVIEILIQSLGEKLVGTEWGGGHVFYYMSHALFVEKYGLGYFEESMRANYEITQRATAEFSVRPYVEQYPRDSLQLFQKWTKDDNEHVRRLVSEGTRPRLPWARPLKQFKEDPRPIFPLLEALKDDSSLYVRRSVANNLNDVAKDNPELLLDLLEKWNVSASKERKWLIRHALRTLIKKGNPRALALLGFNEAKGISIEGAELSPQEIVLGDSLKVSFAVCNAEAEMQPVLVDLIVHYQKANGSLSPKVFKIGESVLSGASQKVFQKKVVFREMTTRKHYAGTHRVEALVNGKVFQIGEFNLTV